jgi:hypothetical protein
MRAKQDVAMKHLNPPRLGHEGRKYVAIEQGGIIEP